MKWKASHRIMSLVAYILLLTQKYVGTLKTNLMECGVLNKNMKLELEKLKNKITFQNNQLYEAAIPALKSLK